jgi:phosphoribosylformylglycinamidine synthase
MAFARVWLDEIKQVGNIDDTAAQFSEPTRRVLVSVGREDDVEFVGLSEARGIPVLRIGVTDGAADTAHLEIWGITSWTIDSLRSSQRATLPAPFG